MLYKNGAKLLAVAVAASIVNALRRVEVSQQASVAVTGDATELLENASLTHNTEYEGNGLHSNYYTQLFMPVFHGQDHRLPATALSELEGVVDTRGELENIGAGQSLMEEEADVGRTQICDACALFVWDVIKLCCRKGAQNTVTCNIRVCEEEIQYTVMWKKEKQRKKITKQRFKRLYMDFTAIGHILHLAEKTKILVESQAERLKATLKQICYKTISETYDCNSADSVRQHMPSSTKHISIQRFYDETCPKKACRGLGKCWYTVRMCPSGGSSLAEVGMTSLAEVETNVDIENTDDDIENTHDESVNPTLAKKTPAKDLSLKNGLVALSNEFDGENHTGLGFPEIPVIWIDGKWRVDDTDAHGFLADGGRAGYLEKRFVGNKSQKVADGVKEIIAGMAGPNIQDALEWLKTGGQAGALIQQMAILLYDMKRDGFYIENIPYFVRRLLQIAYTDERFSSIKRAVGPALQKIAYDHIKEYEDGGNKQGPITDYIKDYRPDLREAELMTGCGLAPPYYNSKLAPISKDAQTCIDDAIASFQNYNLFFSRRLKPETRGFLCYDGDKEICKRVRKESYEEQTIVSPADSRIMLVQDLSEDVSFWIKGEQFNVRQIVSFPEESNYEYYDGGLMIISRLAPQDYHRFHFPIDGQVKGFRHYPGEYWSVNPLAVGSDKAPVFHTNKRMHATIQSNTFGCVLYVSVAATNVGSIGHTSYVGQNVVRGMEHGFMAFGGSTVLIIFPRGVASIDEKIVEASQVPVETIVQVGDRLGRQAGSGAPPVTGSPCR